MSWTVVLVLAAGAYGLKAAGMFGLGRLADGPRAREFGALLPPALLSALIVTQALNAGPDFTVDARTAGVIAGGLAAWRGLPFWAVVLIAAAVTGGIRAV